VDVARAAGDDERLCRELNDAFITAAVLGRPLVTLKMATSLDGKVATATGESRWISGPGSRALVHRWRADHDAVLVGIGTALADDPQLTARDLDGPVRQPARVVLDTRARLPLDAALVATAGEVPTVIVVGDPADPGRVAALRAAGVDVMRVPGDPVDPAAALRELAGRGVRSVFVEGGADVADALVRADLVDVVRWFVAPLLIGGRSAPPGLGGAGVERLAEAPRLRDVTVERVGEDVLVSGRLRPVPETAIEGEG
jgi:diaminohydroxyphosphoribosylaminopyrimidine deaminase / 5-amino-6-(5-phosphoribosylamino)uracil reductase